MPRKERPCCKCGEMRPRDAYTWYAYTTNQGKRSTRRDSACRECRRLARMDRYRRDPDQDKAAAREWRESNRSHISEYNRRYRATKPEMKREAQARRKQRSAPCACCDRKEIQSWYRAAWEHGLEMDHIVPLSRGGKHCLWNLQLLTTEAHKQKTREDYKRWQK